MTDRTEEIERLFAEIADMMKPRKRPNWLIRWWLDKRIRRLHTERHRLLSLRWSDKGKVADVLKYRVVQAKLNALEMREYGYDQDPAVWERY